MYGKNFLWIWGGEIGLHIQISIDGEKSRPPTCHWLRLFKASFFTEHRQCIGGDVESAVFVVDGNVIECANKTKRICLLFGHQMFTKVVDIFG